VGQHRLRRAAWRQQVTGSEPQLIDEREERRIENRAFDKVDEIVMEPLAEPDRRG